jgi:hypothetical protein
VPEFQGKMRLSANPFDLVGADIEVSEGNLALIVSDHEIGEWPLEKVAIDAEVDGFHMTVEGEEFVFTTTEADAFAAAVGISRFGARHKKSGRSHKAVKAPKAHASLVQALATSSTSNGTPPAPQSSTKLARTKVASTRSVSTGSPVVRSTTKAKEPSRPGAIRRLRSLVGRVDISNPQGKIGVASAIIAVVLAFIARPILAGILLFIGMAGVLLIGAASVDPLLATRLPEGWPTSRLALVALTVIVSGLLLVAF